MTLYTRVLVAVSVLGSVLASPEQVPSTSRATRDAVAYAAGEQALLGNSYAEGCLFGSSFSSAVLDYDDKVVEVKDKNGQKAYIDGEERPNDESAAGFGEPPAFSRRG